MIVRWKQTTDTLAHENQHSEDNNFFLYDEGKKVQGNVAMAYNTFMLYRKNISVFDNDSLGKIYQKEMEIMSWSVLDRAILYFKDELLAQLKGGTKWDELQEIFAFSHSYDYLSFLKSKEKIYEALHDKYLEIIGKYIYEAEMFVKNGISLDTLAITPIEKWGRLLKDSLKNSEKNEENFTFENIEDLENGNFFAKKIFENGEIWEGIFDENKRFLEWKKIIGDEIQEWKFFQKNNVNRWMNNEKLSSGIRKYQDVIWEKQAIGEFLQNGISLKSGIEIHGDIMVFLLKNGKIYRMVVLDYWDKKENAFYADISYGNMDCMRENGKFLLKNGELFLQNGKIILQKNLILKVEIEIKDGEIILDDAKIREIDDFLLVFKDLEFKKVLEKYGYNTNKKKNFFKQRFAEIFF